MNIGKTIIISFLMSLIVGSSLLLSYDWYVKNYQPSNNQTTLAQAIATSDQDSINLADVIEAVNPAVVSVIATKDVPIYEQYFEQFDPWGGFFGGGFGIPRIRERGTEEREVGGGSGFFVSPDGLLVTNRHVVADDTARYSIVTNDDETFLVEVVAKDPIFDIAILRVVETEKTEFSYLQFGDSNSLRLGETVIVIGNALAEFRNSVSVGIVSGLARSITARGSRGVVEQLDQVIQTDAAINPGNSGGPMVNTAGEVIGVSVATTQGADNISFALPANMVSDIVSSVVQYGEIQRPYLGVRYTMITPRIKERNKLPVAYGALVARGETREELAVLPGSPADKAGIIENDIILKIDGVALDGIELAAELRKKRVGDSITLTLLHRGDEKEVTVTLEKMP